VTNIFPQPSQSLRYLSKLSLISFFVSVQVDCPAWNKSIGWLLWKQILSFDMQICNSSLKKARDLKRKRFFYSTDGVIFNWAPSQNSPLFHRINFFLAVFSSAYLKSLSKNDKNITHAQLTKFQKYPSYARFNTGVLFTIKGIVSTKNSAELSLQITKILPEMFSSTGNFRSVPRKRKARLLNYLYWCLMHEHHLGSVKKAGLAYFPRRE